MFYFFRPVSHHRYLVNMPPAINHDGVGSVFVKRSREREKERRRVKKGIKLGKPDASIVPSKGKRQKIKLGTAKEVSDKKKYKK